MTTDTIAPPAPDRFVGADAWDCLSDAAQDAVGAAALELAVARLGAEVSHDEREERVFDAAAGAAAGVLDELLAEHVTGASLLPEAEVPPVPSLLGRVCRECGCSEHDACWTAPWDTCGWAEDDLCTTCAEAQVRPRSAAGGVW